jgi:transposase
MSLVPSQSCYPSVNYKDEWMTAARRPTNRKNQRGGEKTKMLNIGIDIGKRKFQACIKEDDGAIVNELSLSNDSAGADCLLSCVNSADARAVVEATGNHWIKLYDTLTKNGVKTILANPVKTRMIAEARIKTDRLDSRVLADLLRGCLVAESYVPTKEERDWRSLVRHRAYLVRMNVDIKNRIESLLDKYELKPEFTDLFGKGGIKWLESLKLESVDAAILQSQISLLRSLKEQTDLITSEIASIAVESEEVKLLMTLPGIDFYSAMLIVAEIGDIDRFPNAKKLCSWAGLVPTIYQSGNTLHMGRITKKGSRWLRWVLIQAAQSARQHDKRLGNFYDRVAIRRGPNKATVAVAREMLAIIYHMLLKKEPYRGMSQKLASQKYKRMEKIASRWAFV